MGGDELDARPGVDSSAHLKLEKDTVLTAGTASRRGTRLSSIALRARPVGECRSVVRIQRRVRLEGGDARTGNASRS